MFRRIANLFRGFFGLFIGGLEKKSPEALLEVEKENLRAQIGQFNQGLAAHAGLVERLISQVKRVENEERELKARVRALLQAGQREAAGEVALSYQAQVKQHEELRLQLEAAETRYKEMVRARDVSIKSAREKIEQLRRGIDDLKVQKAMAELNEMAAGLVTGMGGAGDSLNRLEEIVESERAKAAGRNRVAQDQVGEGKFVVKELEQKALAEMALADFAAAEGIVLEAEGSSGGSGSGGPAGAAGTMGPISQ